MGKVEFSIFYLSRIIEEKFNDKELARQIRLIAQSSDKHAEEANHFHYKTIDSVLNEWDKKYAELMPGRGKREKSVTGNEL
jgi:5-bromo-4-chloroindolyl phosphate hydrolysis protein